MRGYGGWRTVAAIALPALLALTACGSTEEEVRDHMAENYELVSESGQYATYHSDKSVEQVGTEITSAAEPGRDHQDSTGRYLGYEGVMVHIEEAATGTGSEIEVTDARDGYDRWGPTIIPIWGTFGGSYSSGFSGGGSGGGSGSGGK